MHVVFLVEELSMKLLLNQLLPKCLPELATYKIIPHDGRQDLVNSIPKTIKHFKPQPFLFVVLIDKDSNDCITLKRRIVASLEPGQNVLVRIVCTELESWLLGDLSAIDAVYNTRFVQLQQQQKYRNPDVLGNAKQEFKQLLASKHIIKKHLQSIEEISANLTPDNNKSPSFNVFIAGLQDRLAL